MSLHQSPLGFFHLSQSQKKPENCWTHSALSPYPTISALHLFLQHGKVLCDTPKALNRKGDNCWWHVFHLPLNSASLQNLRERAANVCLCFMVRQAGRTANYPSQQLLGISSQKRAKHWCFSHDFRARNIYMSLFRWERLTGECF